MEPSVVNILSLGKSFSIVFLLLLCHFNDIIFEFPDFLSHIICYFYNLIIILLSF